jgi:alcohol dehydrogenase (cytochrome c)
MTRTRTDGMSQTVSSAARSAALAGLMLLVGGATAAAQTPAAGSEDPNNWPQYHRTSNAWRYSPLEQINKSNIGKLKVAWIHQGGDITHGIQETPIVVDGVVYSITAQNRVAALDAKTGRDIWHFEPKLDPLTKKVLFSPYSRGVTVGRGKVFIATVDGRGIAVDQKTGKEAWQVQLTDFANCHGCNFTSPPVLAGDVLTFGSTGGELATAGKIYGVEADSGKKLWEFETIKRDPKSWPGESGKYGGGGAWMPGTYDAETNTVFYGTGNPGKDFVGADREGDNLYTDSVVALDAKTGNLKWYRQEIEHDVWDYDAPYESLLFKKDGKDLLVHLNKSGFVFVMDKHNGNLENIWRLSETISFAKDIDLKTEEDCRPHRSGDGQVHPVLPVGLRRAQLERGRLQPEDRPLVHRRAGVLRCDHAGRAEDRPEGLRHRPYRLGRFRQAGAGAGPQARAA